MSRKRRTKRQIEHDNIVYLLQRNKKAIKQALERYDTLQREGFTTSFAFQKVEEEGGRFNFQDKTYNEVLSELTRVYEFNSNPSSIVSNAKAEGKRFELLFGKGMWARTNLYEMTTNSTDPKVASRFLNEEAASRAFQAYRNIERLRAAEIVGVGGFGSDTFVGYLYSMELQGKDSGLYGNAVLDALEEKNYGIQRDFDYEQYIPANYSQVTRRSRGMREEDIFDNEW